MNVCLYFGNPSQKNEKLGFDEIVKKYGVRVWNGDKIFLQLTEETPTHFKGYAHGVGETGEIVVSIDKEDVVAISRSDRRGGTTPWENVTQMKKFLIGLKCVHNRHGCNCTGDTPDEEKRKFEERYGMRYDRNCYYTLVRVADQKDISLETCLRQQEATDYDHAAKFWVEYQLIDEVNLPKKNIY